LESLPSLAGSRSAGREVATVHPETNQCHSEWSEESLIYNQLRDSSSLRSSEWHPKAQVSGWTV